jgi:hypothetical protein
MLDSAVDPKVIKELMAGMTDFLDRNAERGWKNLSDFRGLRRANVVPHSQIKRPDTADYHGGYADELHEGYAKPIECSWASPPPRAEAQRGFHPNETCNFEPLSL